MQLAAVLVADEIVNPSRLDWILSNLAYSRWLRRAVVAVARRRSEVEREVEKILRRHRADWFEGADEVLERLLQVAEHFSLDPVVKVNFSAPFLNIQLVDRLIERQLASGADYAYPFPLSGEQHVEVIARHSLQEVVPFLSEVRPEERRMYRILPRRGENLVVTAVKPIADDDELVEGLCPDANRRQTIVNFYLSLLDRRPSPRELLDEYSSSESLMEIRARLERRDESGFEGCEETFQWVTRQIAMGPAPTPKLATRLVEEEATTAFLNVASEEFPYRKALPAHVCYRWYGMSDGALIPRDTLIASVMSLSGLCQEGRKVYIHCHAGVSRSGCILALYLALKQRLSYRQAIQKIRQHRPVCNPNPALIDVDSVLQLSRVWEANSCRG
ncbi:MAG: dual specificity protein phosphatase family protein [Acidobacteriota bacterium]